MIPIIKDYVALKTQNVSAESESESNTTLNTFQDKLSLTINPFEAGNYIVEWNAEITNSAVNPTEIRLYDAVNAVELSFSSHTPSAIGEYKTISGFKKVSISESATYILQWRKPTGGIAKIRRARITIRRLP